MQFCTRHSKNLDGAFASLSLNDSPPPSSDPAKNPPLRTLVLAADTGPSQPWRAPSVPLATNQQGNEPTPSPSTELSTILLALRKLREGLLGSSSAAPSPVFSQRVHVFNIRVAILALHPPSYHPSLLHLLFVLHTTAHPLPKSELVEMTTYLILDTAIRQSDLGKAYGLRYNSRIKFGFESRMVDDVLRSIASSDWITFWRVRRMVDGYVRSILYWHLETQRKMALKAIGRSYLSCDVKWILQSAAGGELSWEELVKVEDVGWSREGDKAVIRKPKSKASN